MEILHSAGIKGSISLCMIVKDEERTLSGCLNSLKDCADEMIIVDTGSQDRTVEIAESFGAKVYHHPWEKDFSKHRNQSMRYATGDWILVLDADEALEPGGGEIIRKACGAHDIDSLMLTVVCYFENRTRESWNNSIRLFRNHSGIHYEGRVHNQVIACRSTGFCPVKIYHYGYDLDQSTVRSKFERTSNLLLRAIEENPDRFMHHHDLAVSYASVRLFRKAIQEGLTAISLHDRQALADPNILWTHFVVSSSYFNLGMFDEAERTAREAIRINPDHFDSHFVLASIAASRREVKAFETSYLRVKSLISEYREHPEKLKGLLVNKISETWRLELDRGAVLLMNGREDEAEERFLEGANQSPSPPQALRLAAASSREQGYFDLAERLLKMSEESGLDAHTASFERALIKKEAGDHDGYRSMIRDLFDRRDTLPPALLPELGTVAMRMGEYSKAESLLSSAAEQGYNSPGLLSSLALACKCQGKTERAIELNEQALAMEENDLDTLVNLGNIFYDLKRWESARAMYQRALAADGHQKAALFRLSLISLMDQDLPKCVANCDRLMSELHIDQDITISRVVDLASVYKLIGEGLNLAGEKTLHREAVAFAALLEGNA